MTWKIKCGPGSCAPPPSLLWRSTGAPQSAVKTTATSLDSTSEIPYPGNYYIEYDFAGSALGSPGGGDSAFGPCLGPIDGPLSLDAEVFPGAEKWSVGVMGKSSVDNSPPSPAVIIGGTPWSGFFLPVITVSERRGMFFALDGTGALTLVGTVDQYGAAHNIMATFGFGLRPGVASTPRQPRLQFGWGANPPAGSIICNLFQRSTDWHFAAPGGYTAIP